MTDKDALACIEDVLGSTVRHDESLEYELTSYDVDWLEKAKEAVEKRVPQRAIPQTVKTDCVSIGRVNWRKGTTVYECPNCGTFISPTYDFCYKCGQALDWSDTE